ncbi:hypothetical protein L7F22_020490 [Adiantum nelumboides]|nr:hypothetical protein [Adiantum nelumboides]
MGTNSLIYNFVAKGSVVLSNPPFLELQHHCVQCLEKLLSYNCKQTYACDGYSFNYLVEDGFVFFVVANDSVGRDLPFAFLKRLKEDFKWQYL